MAVSKISFLKTEQFQIKELSGSALPYSDLPTLKIEDIKPVDKDGIILFEQDGNSYYNPVQILETGISFLNQYSEKKEIKYLNLAKKYADRLTENTKEIEGAVFFPYNFNFPLHNLTSPSDLLRSPWYSGMAQGEALTFFSRLYGLTNEKKYLELLEKIFNSFSFIRGEKIPWFSEFDQKGYFWIEEYPSETPCKALNGFIFAIFGLYEYWLLTRKDDVLALLNASLTTVINNIEKYRNKGEFSFYCLKHKKLSATYHKVHIKQLKKLFEITGDNRFQEMALVFEKDGQKAQTLWGKIRRASRKFLISNF